MLVSMKIAVPYLLKISLLLFISLFLDNSIADQTEFSTDEGENYYFADDDVDETEIDVKTKKKSTKLTQRPPAKVSKKKVSKKVLKKTTPNKVIRKKTASRKDKVTSGQKYGRANQSGKSQKALTSKSDKPVVAQKGQPTPAKSIASQKPKNKLSFFERVKRKVKTEYSKAKGWATQKWSTFFKK